jgi:uncharacterized membrane protein
VTFTDVMDGVVRGFEVAGVAVLGLGGLLALVVYARDAVRGQPRQAYERLRQNLGRCILLGLEILIIADIVLTVTIDQTITSAVTLGIIVLVRTFLSFSLEIELEGTVPWRRGPGARRTDASDELKEWHA